MVFGNDPGVGAGSMGGLASVLNLHLNLRKVCKPISSLATACVMTIRHT
jgi:hypothetical protein